MENSQIFTLLSLAMILVGCDLAKPQNPQPLASSDETSSVAPIKPPAKRAVADSAVDMSLELDNTFEDKDYGFQFSYPDSCTLEKGEGFVGSGTLSLWFSKPKFDSEAVLMTLKWMVDNQPKTRSEINEAVKQNGGSLKTFEKVNLDDKECMFIKVAYGGMMDPRGSRISEQYLLTVKKGSDLTINFSGPANKFESHRPQFNAVLKSFKFDKE